MVDLVEVSKQNTFPTIFGWNRSSKFNDPFNQINRNLFSQIEHGKTQPTQPTENGWSHREYGLCIAYV